ncbi:RNA helicase [Malassezia sp. CBS 17886]|nr:RNA helicase [Malassezia sp. CBS 17886]
MAGPKRRERFNAKARQSSAGGSSHKGRKSMRERERDQQQNTNVALLNDATRQALHEQDRQRRELLRAGGGDADAKIDSKKRKRLDKFIAQKLRKEEKARLIQKISASSQEIQDRTELVSAATLGTGRATKQAQRIEKLAASAQRPSRRGAAAFVVQEDDHDEDLDADGKRHDAGEGDGDERQARILQAVRTFGRGTEARTPKGETEAPPGPPGAMLTGTAPSSAPGSALAPGSDGTVQTPVMRKRQRKSGGMVSRSNMPLQERVRAKAGGSRGMGMGKGTGEGNTRDEADEEDEDGEEDGEEDGGNVDGRGLHVYDVDKSLKAIRARRAAELAAAKGRSGDVAAMSDLRSATDDLGSEEADTDEDDEAVLLHAMRLRGMRDLRDISGRRGRKGGGGREGMDEDDGGEDGEDDEGAEDETGEDDEGTDEEGEADEEEEETDEEEEADGEEEADDDEGSDDDEGEGDDDDEEDNEGQNDVEGKDDAGTNDPLDKAAAARKTHTPHHNERANDARKSLSEGFKEWALEALHLARPHADEDGHTLEPVGGHTQRVGDLGPQDGKARGPLGRDMDSPAKRSQFTARYFDEEAHFRTLGDQAPTRHVDVTRTQAENDARIELPVYAEEDLILRTIQENPITILCGETGSGKTTQVPQFLYEAAYAAAGSGAHL